MSHLSKFRSVLLAGAAVIAVAGCSDSNIASPGEGQLVPAPAPTPGGGGGSTGATYDLTPTGGCPSGTAQVTIESGNNKAILCEVLVNGSGAITADLTLITSSPTGYYFSQPTFVGTDDGPTTGALGGSTVDLTIQPGAILIFKNPTDFLTVNRGSRILSKGTQAEPVIFTSDEDILDDGVANDSQGSVRGQWGGLIFNGRANINNCTDPSMPTTCETSGEGGTGSYGGAENGDDSGTLNYVRVQYAGFEITTDNELNGVAFQGVGDGTNIDFLQVHNNDDDGVEFFGGRVNARHLVITGVDDDGLDWVAGWQGSVQDVVIIGSGVGDNGFEGDNNENGNDLDPRSNPTISNFTLVGGPTEDLGMQIREGTAGTFINGVIAGWEDGCLDIDDAATFDQVGSGALDIVGTYFSCDTPFDDTGNDVDSGSNPVDISTVFGAGVTTGVSTLSGVLPGVNEENVAAEDPQTYDATFEKEEFAGAFQPGLSPAQTWAFGWTVPNSVFAIECPDGTTDISDSSSVSAPASGKVCQLPTSINQDLTLRAGNRYAIVGPTFVGQDRGPDAGNPATGNSATLTIEAGVEVFGVNPTDFLTIRRGSQLVATGTESAPIVFTSDEDLRGVNSGDERGQWGGLILNGRANINNCTDPSMPASCSTSGEGGTGSYGGNDNNDDSGLLNYIRVQYAGFEITTDNELNGIAFQGVGDGTEVDFIQVHNNDDDGVEFFGGTVDAKHIVLTGVDDDGLDWVAGWKGSVQFVLIAGSGVGDNGLEGDNNENGNDLDPRSNPIISNFTLVGGPTEDLGMQIREGTAGLFVNGVVAGWEDGCLDVDDAATFDNIEAAPADVASDGVNDVDLQIDATFFSCSTAFDDTGNDEDSGSNPVDISTAFGSGTVSGGTAMGGPGIYTGSSTLTGVENGANENAITPVDPQTLDSSFDTVTVIGANGAEDDWYNGWTVSGSF